jgi:hypothetical protein
MVHGSSPLATAAVLSSNSGSDDDDSDDSEFEEVPLPGNNGMITATAPGGDADADDDDFLAAAFNDETGALQDNAASDQSGISALYSFSVPIIDTLLPSDDSSDESDYDER